MFASRKLETFLIQALLLNRAAAYVKPHVIRPVHTPDVLAVPRVRLDTQTLSTRFAHTLDARPTLPFEVRSDELFDPRVARHDAPRC